MEEATLNDSKEILNYGKSKEQYFEDFAGILSKLTYNNQEVREFLKREASAKFDKNYDILYQAVKNKNVGNSTFRELLINHSSEKEIQEIESNVPLLNILIPRIQFFNITAENMDTNDKEIPVAVSKDKTTSLYLDGKKELDLEKGEVPDFHVFVVNENSRVIIPKTRNGEYGKYTFKSPNYDGTKQENTRVAYGKNWAKDLYDPSTFTPLVKSMYHFYKKDNSINQIGFQRDYIYYGITPENQKGKLNHNVSEYISYIKVDPKAYFKISDQRDNKETSNIDPYINEWEFQTKGRDWEHNEIIDKMWTKGAYNFRFEIIKSNKSYPQVVYLPLFPEDLWEMPIEKHRRHPTLFRSTKYTYKINVKNFRAKDIYLKNNQIDLGRWDISQEGLTRQINISEEDESAETTHTVEYEIDKMSKNSFKADVKLELGFGEKKDKNNSDKLITDVSFGHENNKVTKEKHTVTVKRKQASDNLGSVEVYFYHPLSTGEWKEEDFSFVLKTYNTGIVEFALNVK